MNKLLTPAILAAVSLMTFAADFGTNQFLPNLGRFTHANTLLWDPSPANQSVILYSVYVGPTNFTSWTRVAEVTSNWWAWTGPNIPSLDGTRAVYLTASSLAGESAPSPLFILDFRFGPTPPQNPRKVTNSVVVP